MSRNVLPYKPDSIKYCFEKESNSHRYACTLSMVASDVIIASVSESIPSEKVKQLNF